MKKFILTIAAAFLATGLFAQSVKSWTVYVDNVNGGTSTADVKTANGVTNFSGSVTTAYQYGYAGLTMDGDPAFIDALKKAKGLRVTVKGDGKQYNFRVETSDRPDYCFHEFTITAPAKEKTFEIPFSKLVQESWGAKKVFKPELITTVSFQTVGQPISSFNLDVIKVEIMN